MANTGREVVLGMLFLIFSRANIRFAEREFIWRTYTVAEALPTTKRMEIIDKKEFAVAALNANNKIFVLHIVTLAKPTTIPIHPSCQAQVVLLISEKIRIPIEYFNFSNIFSSDSATELPEHIGNNDHPINLLNNKQLPYGPIYSPGPVELEILKTYIKANLARSFIRPSKSPTGVPILFVQKKDISVRRLSRT